MAVPVYDPLLHHVGLGVPGEDEEDTSWLKGFITVGPTSRQMAAPVFERPTGAGPDDLISSSTHSTWTQTDYTGGEFQDDYQDEAMFAQCQSMIPSQLTRSLRTVKPLIPINIDDLTVGNVTPVSMDVIEGNIFVIWNTTGGALNRGKVYRYNIVDPTGSGLQHEQIPTSDLASGEVVCSSAWSGDNTRLWVGTSTPNVLVYDYNSAAATGSRLVLKKTLHRPDWPSDPVERVLGIHLFGALRFIVTGHGDGDVDNNHVWLYVSGSDADTKWTHVGSLPGQVQASVTYNNAVYFLTRSGDASTQLSMSQGDEVFPVLDLPYAFRGMAMIEYAGRLYISGAGYDLGGTELAGELYEVSGTSLRLVRTFSTEAYAPVPDWIASQMGFPPIGPHVGSMGRVPLIRRKPLSRISSLCVQEGLLWMQDDSWGGLEAYDATTDAFFGGPSKRGAIDDDPSYQVYFTKIRAFGSGIILWGTSPTAGLQGIYRTEQPNEEGGTYVPFIQTSDFHPEPGRRKVWSKLAVLTRSVAPVTSASSDGGLTWTTLEAASTETLGTRFETVYELGVLPATRALRFRFEFPMLGDEGEAPAELIAHSCSFIVMGDNKRKWLLQVNAGLLVDGLDENGEQAQPDPTELCDFLWSLKDQTTAIRFVDVDRHEYDVLVTDITRTVAVLTSSVEAYVPITLTEV